MLAHDDYGTCTPSGAGIVLTMSRKEVHVHDSIAEVDENQWNNLVAQSETGSVFQRTQWLRTVEEGFDSDPKHVVVTQDGNVMGACPNFEVEIELPEALSRLSQFAPRKAVSARPGFGGPITTSMDASIIDPLFEGIDLAIDDGVAYHQLNLLDQTYLGWAAYFQDRGYVPSVKSCRFVVDLNRDFERVRDRMSKDRRYNLRKGEEQEYRVVDDDVNRGTVESFHEKYARAMDRVGAEPLPRRFFVQLAERLGDNVQMFSLEVDGTRAGTHLYLLDNDRGAVHHYASAVEESDFEYYPSELLHAHAIKWGSDHGFDQYDFGETPADFTDGLYRYKKQFGGEPVPTLAWERGLSKGRWHLFRLGRWYYRQRIDS